MLNRQLPLPPTLVPDIEKELIDNVAVAIIIILLLFVRIVVVNARNSTQTSLSKRGDILAHPAACLEQVAQRSAAGLSLSLIPAFSVRASYTGTFSLHRVRHGHCSATQSGQQTPSSSRSPRANPHWPVLVRRPSLNQSQGFLLAGPGSHVPKHMGRGREGTVPQRKSERLLFNWVGMDAGDVKTTNFQDAPPCPQNQARRTCFKPHRSKAYYLQFGTLRLRKGLGVAQDHTVSRAQGSRIPCHQLSGPSGYN